MKKFFITILLLVFIGGIIYKLSNIREFGYSNKSPDGKHSIEIYSTENFFADLFNGLVTITAPGDGGSGRTKAYAVLLNKDGYEIGNTGNTDFLYNEIDVFWNTRKNKVLIVGAGEFNLKTGEFCK